MAASTQVSVEEYLNTAYRPDVEYINGELRPKGSISEVDPMVQWAHAHLQALISAWFVQHQDEWSILVGVEARTQVHSLTYRLPDVVVLTKAPERGTITEAPRIVVEILSPGDTYSETQRRARDYQDMGIENIWLIDPDTRTARVCKGENWTEVTRFAVPDSPIYLDVFALFARLDQRRSVK